MSLSIAQLREHKPNDKFYKVNDHGGLFIAVLPSGSMSWRYQYSF